MPTSVTVRRYLRTSGIAAVLWGLSLATASVAAAAPPQIVSTTVVEETVSATGATLAGSINPNGVATTYRFEYLTEAAYEANLGASRDPFFGAALAPVGGFVGSGSSPIGVTAPLKNLLPDTSYRYRLRAIHSGEEPVFSVTRPFATQPPTNAFALLDHRGWEMVSPIDKNGGAISAPGTVSGGGVFQAAAGAGAFTYSSVDSFGAGAQSAPSGSQYVATRGGSGWANANISTPMLSGSYGSDPDGPPYQLFSGSLGFGLLSNGERCRGEAGGECPVANPALPGSGAPAGYRDYYRRTGAGGFESLLEAADLSHTSLGPQQFELRLVAATPDLAHVVVSSCAALTANATEVTAPGGCDPAAQNLYEWSGGGLSLVNLLPAATTGTPGARIAAPSGSISSDGSRVYFTAEGNLYLREGNATKLVLETAPNAFAGASVNGSVAYLVAAGQLSRYSATAGTVTPLTTGSAVEGVLGISADGSKVYYAESGAVFLRDGATVTEVASSALPSNWPPATGSARVSADGSHLLFLSDAELTGYPSEGKTEVFLYGPPPGGGAQLTCVSCNPSGETPQGSATIPGARPNGSGPGAIAVYKPRNLSADGNRVFFETPDSMSSGDTNSGVTDVYEWEAGGAGTCASSDGCVQLISGGRDQEPAYFLDADEGGGQAFFLTAASLYPPDPGSYDVYVAAEGGGFAVPVVPIPCVADACQVLPAAPEDPTPGTLVPNAGNPPLTVAGAGKATKPKHKKHGKKQRDRRAKQHGKRGGRRR